MKKDVKDVVLFARDHGFSLAGMTGKSHWLLRHHSGATITLACSPSRGRWRQNAEAQIRRIHRNSKDSK